MRVGFWVSSLSILSVLGAVPAFAELKKLDNLSTDIFASPREGRLVARVKDSAQVLVWEEEQGSLKPVFSAPQSGASYSIRYATSQSGKYLLVRQELRTVPPTDPEFQIFDLAAEEIKPVVIPESRTTTLMPLIYPDDSRYLFISSALTNENSIFTFPIAEYAWDKLQGTAQPTGFYMETVPESDYATRVADGVVSPDGQRAALLVRPLIVSPVHAPVPGRFLPRPGGVSRPVPTPAPTPAPAPAPTPGFSSTTPTPVPFAPAAAIGGSRGLRSVRLLDIKSGKHQEVPLPMSVESVYWPSDDILIFKSAEGLQSEGSLYKFRISDQELTRLTTEGSDGEEFSKDGRWLLYARSAKFRYPAMRRDGPFDPAAVVLVDVASGTQYEFLKATSAVFGEDAKSLVLRVEDDPSDKPFARVDMAPFLDASAPKSVDLQQDNPGVNVARLGFVIPRYQIPTEKEAFDANIELKAAYVSQVRVGYMLRLELRNKSDVHFGISTQFQLSCELVDSSDKVVLSQKPFVSPNVSPVATWNWEPGTVRVLTCPLTDIGSKSPPFLLKGKVRYSLHQNAKAFHGEVAFP